jgi:hypothetical protein
MMKLTYPYWILRRLVLNYDDTGGDRAVRAGRNALETTLQSLRLRPTSLVDCRDDQGGRNMPVSFSLLDEATPQSGNRTLIGMQDHPIVCHSSKYRPT